LLTIPGFDDNNRKTKTLFFFSFWLFFLIFDGKKARAGKLAESQELKAKSRRISGVKS